MRARLCLLVLAIGVVAPAGARANPVTQDPCPGVAAAGSFKQLGNDVLENLLFADGSLWISDGTTSSIRRFAADGNEGTGLRSIPSPGGLTVGPDGLIYAGWGNSIQNSVMRTTQAKVVRFDAADPNGTVQTYAEGFNMPNGMTWGPNDDLFVSNDLDAGLVRIPRAHPAAWSLLNDTWGTNGLVVHGTTLYSAITFDQRSPIEAHDLSTVPAQHRTAVQLTAGVVSVQPNVYTNGDPSKPLVGLKGLDDMTSDGTYLYPVANGMGELLRVDPISGDACLIASGLQNPSSVRIAPEPSAFADGDVRTIDFYITEFSGAIRLVTYAPAPLL